MNRHILKTHPAMFHAVKRGVKPFEVRKDDRAFQAGDIVELRFHDPDGASFTDIAPSMLPDELQPIHLRVTFVLRGGQYGVEPGFVVLGLHDIGGAGDE